MVAAILLSALAMSAIVGVRYLLASGGFALATRIRQPGLYRGLEKQMGREIAWSLASALIYGIPAGVVAWGWQAHGWTRIYTDVAAMPLWYLPLSVLLYLAAHDTWFYWPHRWEALTGAVVIPALVFLIPIHVGALGVVLTIMTVMGVSNHMGWEMFPRWMVRGPIGGWLITATHHQRHHDRYNCNYGLYFRFWDRLCGTDQGLGDFTTKARA